MAILVVDYDPAWTERFAKEVVRIALHAKRALGHTEHVGSTAVPWLAARPTIDLLAFVESPEKREALREVLAAIEYRHEPTPHDPYLAESWRYDGEAPARLYLVRPDSRFAADAMAVRDYLRIQRPMADAYGSFKKELAAKPETDAAAYAIAKLSFLRSILRQARAVR